MIVISDVHGCYKTLMALTEKLPHKDLCFVGDLIDRGPLSDKVIDYVRENDHKCVLGNHEQMMITSDYDFHSYNMWIENGGDKTKNRFNDETLQSTKEWLKTLPVHIEYTTEEGKEIVISHSTVVPVWHLDKTSKEFKHSALWSRIFPESEHFEGKTNVIGHTPVREIVLRNQHILLDTGCVYGRKLSAIDLETGAIYQQELIDEVQY